MFPSRRKTLAFFLFTLLISRVPLSAQQTRYPKEIRGYKVIRKNIEAKKSANKTKIDPPSDDASLDLDPDALIRLGDPEVGRITPLGITFDIPIVVSPVKQKGHVDFLVFEEMQVNETSVEIEEYRLGFDLPNKDPLKLSEPLKFYVYLPSAVLVAIDEWNNSKPTWLITGKVYVFGKFKKSLFSFKRCIPIEVKRNIRNPINR